MHVSSRAFGLPSRANLPDHPLSQSIFILLPNYIYEPVPLVPVVSIKLISENFIATLDVFLCSVLHFSSPPLGIVTVHNAESPISHLATTSLHNYPSFDPFSTVLSFSILHRVISLRSPSFSSRFLLLLFLFSVAFASP